MKKIFAFVLTAIFALSALGCGSTGDTGGVTPNPFQGKALTAILDEVYAGADVDASILANTEITAENEQYFLGTAGLQFAEGLASEPMLSSSAYSVCLLRMKEGEDAAAVAKAIKEGVDPAKWICVQVDEQNVIADSAGDVVILIMTNEYAKALHESFRALV